MGLRSMTVPPSHTDCPGKLWPPPRTARGKPALVVNRSAALMSEAPVQRATGFDTPYPHSLEWAYFPGPVRIGTALKKALEV